MPQVQSLSHRFSSAVHGVLRSHGFNPADFELESETHAADEELLGTGGGVLRIRCNSTGEERMYATGAASTWLGAFLMDLGRGHFGSAVRHPFTSSGPLPTGA